MKYSFYGLPFLLLMVSSYSHAILSCQGDDPQSPLIVCSDRFAIESANGCPSPTTNNLTQSGLAEQLAQNPVGNCPNETWGSGAQGLTKKQKQRKLKKLKKQCKKEAAAYKKEVFKNMMSQGRLGQALQAMLKGKRRIIAGSGENENSNIKVDNDIANMSPDQLKQFISSEITRLHPDVSQSGRNGFQKRTVPFDMVVNSAGGESCKLSSNDFPEEEEFTPTDCELCEPVDVMSSFTNDCSYMVNSSEGLTEKRAQELMGIRANQRSNYCQPENMAGQRNDLGPIKDIADKVCRQAQSGVTPKLTIETSRNLYNDKTPELAHKRGLFIQNYLRSHLQNNCPFEDGQPEWLTDSEQFNSRFELKFPTYAGVQDGNYGPNPYAQTPSEQSSEVEKFRLNLESEKAQFEANFRRIEAEIRDSETEITRLNRELHGQNNRGGIKRDYQALQGGLNNNRNREPDVLEIQNQTLQTLGNQALSIYTQKHELQQKMADLRKKQVYFQRKITESQSAISSKVGMLQQYYAAGESRNKAQWDQDLFNDFKMARISFEPQTSEDFLPNEVANFDPGIKSQLETLLELQTYTCQLNPIETRATSLEGILKFPLKVATIATLPITAGIGAAVSVAASPFTTTLGLLCRGCREPGSRMPSFYHVGNLTSLDLSRSGRADGWSNAKDFVSSYVNWGGALRINSERTINLHDLQTHHPNWNQLNSDQQTESIFAFINRISPSSNMGENSAEQTQNASCDSSSTLEETQALPSGSGDSASSGATQQ